MQATESALDVHVRWMMRRDRTEVLDIEFLSFEHPWAEEDFKRCVHQRNVIGMVAENGEQVVGFVLYELHKRQIDIVNFAVHPDFRRHRVGTQMVATPISKLSHQRRERILLGVGERNLRAQLFFQACGFLATAVLPGHFEKTGEDAYVMEYSIIQEG